MCRKNHTLAATYTNLGDNKYVSKTITGCVVGQPVIIGASTTFDADFVIFLKVVSGSLIGTTNGTYYRLGTYWSVGGDSTKAKSECCAMSFVIVPTATSVTLSFGDVDSDETVYVYKT